MKYLTILLSPLFIFSIATSQESSKDLPFYDYANMILSNEATIADFEQKANKLQISGVVYEADGVTPAKDVIIYVYQHDENGEFQYQTVNDRRRLRHRLWIKTSADGSYTFNTFMPGEAIVPLNYPRRYGPKQIYLVAKTPSSDEFFLPAFMFEGDDLLSKSCIKRLERKGIDCILKPEMKDGILIANKDIILPQNATESN
jgi:protocatechuate 3,4-dioxygenase beta subunit